MLYRVQSRELALSSRWKLGSEADTSNLFLFRGVEDALGLSGNWTSIKVPVSQDTAL